MRFTLTIDCDNDAFEDRPTGEVERILLEMLERGRLWKGTDRGELSDINGNTVGRFGFDDGEAR